MKETTNVWEVFIQSKNGLAHKHAGNVHADDKEMALQNINVQCVQNTSIITE